MINVLFVCTGNICRSTMAEFLFRDMVKKAGLSDWIQVASAGTSNEEEGNPVHPGTRKKLRQIGIATDGKYAIQIRSSDYDRYDFLIGMDRYHIMAMNRLFRGDPEKKIYKFLGFCGEDRDVADPWYTGDFDTTFQDVSKGCTALFQFLISKIDSLK